VDLRARSVEVILAGQSPSGAYVACPNKECDYRREVQQPGELTAPSAA